MIVYLTFCNMPFVLLMFLLLLQPVMALHAYVSCNAVRSFWNLTTSQPTRFTDCSSGYNVQLGLQRVTIGAILALRKKKVRKNDFFQNQPNRVCSARQHNTVDVPSKSQLR